jgi:TcpE family
MPLPLGRIAAFAGITVPYALFLTLIGIPFSHNLFWLYVLPSGVLTWLVARPVLENKKLPELLVSHVRYLRTEDLVPNGACRGKGRERRGGPGVARLHPTGCAADSG